VIGRPIKAKVNNSKKFQIWKGMAERPPNRFQQSVNPNLAVMFDKSDSEESRPRQGKRTRQPTARFVDEISSPLKAQYAAMKKRKVQRRNVHIEEMKRQDRVARLGLSEPDLSDSQTQPAKRVRTELERQGNNGPTASRLLTSSSRMVDEVDRSSSSEVAARPTTSSSHVIDEVEVSNPSGVVLRNSTSSSRMVDKIVDISRPPDGPSGMSSPTGVVLQNNTSSSRMVDEIVDISRPPSGMSSPTGVSSRMVDEIMDISRLPKDHQVQYFQSYGSGTSK